MPSRDDSGNAGPGFAGAGSESPEAGHTVPGDLAGDLPALGAARLGALVDDARVPLDEIYRALDGFEEQARARGDSPRAVHQVRHRLARQLGHTATAEHEFELWIAAPRDLASGCFACEQGQIGDWYAERGEDARAFEAWDGLLDGSVFCDAEPHAVLARSLIPLIRLGKGRQAQENHDEGYRISRLKPPMCAQIGAHIEFCALTGNAARGLELLAEHGHWLAGRAATGPVEDGNAAARHGVTEHRAAFLGGVSVLLRALTASGLDDLPFAIAGAAIKPIGELRDEVDAELSSIAVRFDERNGTSAFSSRIVHRRSRQPFLSALALDARTVLPAAPARTGRRAAAPAPRPKPRPVADLVTEARRLTELWHPDALDAWKRAQAAAEASGTALPEDAKTELDEQAALADGGATGIGGGVAAAVQRARLLEIADRYRAQGRLGLSLRAASRAALALARSGQRDAAASDQSALRAAAADALAGHEITPSEYLAVRIGSGYQKFHAWQSLATATAASDESADRIVGKNADVAKSAEETDAAPSLWFGGKPRADTGSGEGKDGKTPASPEPDDSRDARARAARDALAELQELTEECRRFEVALYGAAAAGMAAHVRLGSGETKAAEQNLRLCVELYHEGGAPWCATAAELNLGRIARARGELPAAERYARAAVEHNLDPALRGSAAMLLAEAIWLQDGREAEAVAPALAAAAAFARREGGADDEARAQLLAAEALAVAGRPEEAIALFAPALKVADAHWDQDDWKPVIAQAARAYGNSLIAAGDPRRAAELLLSTATRVKDWPNQIPHAMLAADAATALERAGRHADAIAAFERAAQLWQDVGDPLVRVKCLRSAAWLIAADDLDAALGVMDGAGGELITALAAEDENGDWHAPTRYELAETHLQRARIVLNLAESRSLAADDSEKLLGEAYQHATAAINGLRRLIPAPAAGGAGDDGAETEDKAGDGAGIDAGGPSFAPRGLLFERLSVALVVAARIEAGHLDRAVAAAARLRDWAAEFESWDKPELAHRLTDRAGKLYPGGAVVALVPAAPDAPASSEPSHRYLTVA